jgi:hypothetical protein
LCTEFKRVTVTSILADTTKYLVYGITKKTSKKSKGAFKNNAGITEKTAESGGKLQNATLNL